MASRDACRAGIVLATLADGPATNADLRRATGASGRLVPLIASGGLRDRGLIVALPGERTRWALASTGCDARAARLPADNRASIERPR